MGSVLVLVTGEGQQKIAQGVQIAIAWVAVAEVQFRMRHLRMKGTESPRRLGPAEQQGPKLIDSVVSRDPGFDGLRVSVVARDLQRVVDVNVGEVGIEHPVRCFGT
jgi:hypothetical protein